MFIHAYIYRLRCLVRNKELVFWTLLFCLFQATLSFFAFGHLTVASERFEPISVAVIDSPAYQENSSLRLMLEQIASPGEGRLLHLTVTDETEAQRLLLAEEVSGVIEVGDGIGLRVGGSGINESILLAILDSYAQTEEKARNILFRNPSARDELFRDIVRTPAFFTQEVFFSSAPPQTQFGYFYALVGVCCMYTSFWGLRNTTDCQADLSPTGARRSVAPTHKLTVVLADAAASLTVGFSEVLMLLGYLRLLGVGFGGALGYILLNCFMGCIAGVSFGYFVGTVVPGSANLKVGVLVTTSLLMGALSGLMYINLKDIVARSAPILSYLNPASLIADAFYSLYVYSTYGRFYTNMIALGLISVFFSTISYLRLRRVRYASI